MYIAVYILQAELARNSTVSTSVNSAKESADIGKYSTEVLRLHIYHWRHLDNIRTLKLTMKLHIRN